MYSSEFVENELDKITEVNKVGQFTNRCESFLKPLSGSKYELLFSMWIL